jgi:dTDP-4-dehydrorhamnose reductase
LVIGHDGQVARALSGKATRETSVQCLGRPALDITDSETIKRAIASTRPDVVVNAAAYTAVDKAESEPECAFAVNARGARNVAGAAAAAGIPVIHLSTDYVFSGDKPSPYFETDLPGPVSVYGRSKLAGELAVADANPAHVVLRTAWVYAASGQNFAKTMLRLAGAQDAINVVADQHGAPTHAPDIADGILLVARRLVERPDDTSWRGTFHMTALGATTWAGFAEAVFAASAARGGPSAKVRHIATAEYPTAAKRPANSRLDSSRFRDVFGHSLPDWKTSVCRWADLNFADRP